MWDGVFGAFWREKVGRSKEKKGWYLYSYPEIRSKDADATKLKEVIS